MPTNSLGSIAILADPELTAITRSNTTWPNYYKPEILRKIKDAVSLILTMPKKSPKLTKAFFKFIKSYIEAKPETITQDAFTNLNHIVTYSIENMQNKFLVRNYIVTPNDNLLECLDLIKTMFSTGHFHQYLNSAFEGLLLIRVGVTLEAILKNSPNNPLITPSLSQYFSILASSANNNALLIDSNALLVQESLKLAKLCSIHDDCNTAEINDKIAHVLGTFNYHLRGLNTTDTIYAATTLEKEALPFLKDYSTDEQNLFNSFISSFFSKRTLPENLPVQCLSANISTPICKQVTFIDATTLSPTTTELPTTLITSASITARPTFTPETTTTPIPTTTTDYPSLATNQTSSTNSPIDLFSPNEILPKLAGSFTSGFVIIIKDDVLHKLYTVLAHILERKGCPAYVINMLKGTFWLLNTTSTAALPLLYAYASNIIQALNENETKDVLTDSQLIMSISICFALEALFTTSNLLEKKSTLRKTINYLKPLLVFTGMITTSAHITEGLAIYSASAAGGVSAKGLTKGISHAKKSTMDFFRPSKTTRDSESKLVSSDPSAYEMSSVKSSSSTSGSDISLPEPPKAYFIRPEKFDTIKNNLTSVITCLEDINLSFKKYNDATKLAKSESLESANTVFLDNTITSNDNKIALINESIKQITVYQLL